MGDLEVLVKLLGPLVLQARPHNDGLIALNDVLRELDAAAVERSLESLDLILALLGEAEALALIDRELGALSTRLVDDSWLRGLDVLGQLQQLLLLDVEEVHEAAGDLCFNLFRDCRLHRCHRVRDRAF